MWVHACVCVCVCPCVEYGTLAEKLDHLMDQLESVVFSKVIDFWVLVKGLCIPGSCYCSRCYYYATLRSDSGMNAWGRDRFVYLELCPEKHCIVKPSDVLAVGQGVKLEGVWLAAVMKVSLLLDIA